MLIIEEESDQLRVDYTERSDADEYICIAKNHLASTSSDPCTVTVEWAPELLSELEPLEVLVSIEGVSLTCNISASPAADIIWYSEQQDELGSAEVQVLQNSEVIEYHISNPLKDHSGKYWCRGENMHGAVRSNVITLTVRQVAVPTITKTIRFGYIITSSLKTKTYMTEELSQQITNAIEQSVGLEASATISWTEDGSSGLITVSIILNNRTSEVPMSHNVLSALCKNNLN